MKYFVYIIQSELDGSFYIGHTGDLKERLLRHNSGRNKYTLVKAPWRLVHTESFSSRAEAVKRERAIKAEKSSKYIERLILPR